MASSTPHHPAHHLSAHELNWHLIADILNIQSNSYKTPIQVSVSQCLLQEPTEFRKQPFRTRYLGHVTGYQPIRDQYFLIRSVPGLLFYSSSSDS